MSDRDPMVHIRIPESLRQTLQALARNSGRSMNAEIVDRLQHSVDDERDGISILKNANLIVEHLREALKDARRLAEKE